MQINQYLIISQGNRSWNHKVKLVRTLKGIMPANAIALKLNIILPDHIFKKPQLEATIKIKDEDVTNPIIKADVLDNIKQVFAQTLGMDMNIRIVEPSEEIKTHE